MRLCSDKASSRTHRPCHSIHDPIAMRCLYVPHCSRDWTRISKALQLIARLLRAFDEPIPITHILFLDSRFVVSSEAGNWSRSDYLPCCGNLKLCTSIMCSRNSSSESNSMSGQSSQYNSRSWPASLFLVVMRFRNL